MTLGMGEVMEPERITLILTRDADGPGAPMWCVSSPELPGVCTQGRTVASALEMAADAVRGLGLNRDAKDEPKAGEV